MQGNEPAESWPRRLCLEWDTIQLKRGVGVMENRFSRASGRNIRFFVANATEFRAPAILPLPISRSRRGEVDTATADMHYSSHRSQ